MSESVTATMCCFSTKLDPLRPKMSLLWGSYCARFLRINADRDNSALIRRGETKLKPQQLQGARRGKVCFQTLLEQKLTNGWASLGCLWATQGHKPGGSEHCGRQKETHSVGFNHNLVSVVASDLAGSRSPTHIISLQTAPLRCLESLRNVSPANVNNSIICDER